MLEQMKFDLTDEKFQSFFVLLQQQISEYIQHLYRRKSILERMIAWQLMLYWWQSIKNWEYRMHDANYLEKQKIENSLN